MSWSIISGGFAGSADRLRPFLALCAAMGLALAVAGPSSAQETGSDQAAAPSQPFETCVPAALPFDPEHIALTGLWSVNDGGMYYIRQVGDKIWWNGMSDYPQENADAGRDFNNVGHGTINKALIGMEYADVPRGNIWGNGNISLKVEGDTSGNLRIRKLTGDFGGEIFTPCEPKTQVADDFARPFSYITPFGTGSSMWQGGPEAVVVWPSEVPGSGMTAWIIGPGFGTTCSAPVDAAAPSVDSPEALIDYLGTIPELTVSEPSEITVDGRAALSVDVGTLPTATGCAYDDYVRFWKSGDFEGGINVDSRTRIVALDVDGATVALELWSDIPDRWVEPAQGLLDSIRFDAGPSLSETIGEPADDGARIVRVDVRDERTRDLVVESPSVGYTKVRLLLPDDFDAASGDTWPTLYLLHSQWDDFTAWTRETDVADVPELHDVLVAMPGAGGNGWYSDWSNNGGGGSPSWETFHTAELPQLLERNWSAGDLRSVAGADMGGFGALSYAARHPGMFKAAASYSGITDTTVLDFPAPDPLIWGKRTDQRETWEAHNPMNLAEDLAGTELFISYGNGSTGPLDESPVAFDDDENRLVRPMNEAFAARLGELDIPATIDAYGAGSHSWPYWEQELHKSLPVLLGALEE